MRTVIFPLLILASPVALAQSPAAKGAGAAEPEKKICRMQGETGSLLSKRICHTKAEWQAIEAANESDAARYRDRPMANNRQIQE